MSGISDSQKEQCLANMVDGVSIPILYRSLSNDLRGKKFNEEKDLKKYLQDFFDSKPAKFYHDGIHDLARRWREIIDS